MLSRIVLGTMMFGWKIPHIKANEVMDLAVKNGIDTLDTSPSYGGGLSELMCGKLIERYPETKVSTKFTIPNGFVRGDLTSELFSHCKQSLSRLNKDQIDFYTLHHDRNLNDIDMLCESILALKENKLIKFFFLSNVSQETYIRIKYFEKHNKVRVVDGLQLKKNLLFSDDLFKLNLDESDIIYSYSPLCEGLLTGKYLATPHPPKKTRLAEVNRHLDYYAELMSPRITNLVLNFQSEAREKKLSLTEYSYISLFLLKNITKVIVGPSNRSQLFEAIKCEKMAYQERVN